MKKYILFGAGLTGIKMLKVLGEESVICFCDNYKSGSKLAGKEIISFDQLKDIAGDCKVLISVTLPGISHEIEQQLAKERIDYATFQEYCLLQFKKMQEHCDEYYIRYKKEIDYMLSIDALPMLPYPFCRGYLEYPLNIEYDSQKKMYYYAFQQKRLYLPFDNAQDAESYVRAILMEQDSMSPHQYFDLQHLPMENDVFIDVGCAEGFIALSVVQRVKKILLIEGDTKWFSALRATFEPYQEKVCFITKMIGDVDDEHMVTADTALRDIEGNLFFKVDIEGNEEAFLRGAANSLRKQNTRMSICTYHRVGDADDFEELLSAYGYKTKFSTGFMFVGGEFQKGVLKGSME